MSAELWWRACFGILAFVGLGELVTVVVVWPVTGHVPAVGTFIGLIGLPLSLIALRNARRVRDDRGA